MHAWAGNALGSFIGLFALLLGALYNARLTRKRDDRMHTEKRESIAAAVAAELTAFGATLAERMGFMYGYVEQKGTTHPVEAAIARCRLPASTVIEHLGDRIGLLDAETAYQVVQCWHGVQLVANLLAVTSEEIRAGVFNTKLARERWGYARDLELRCATLAEALSGIKTGPLVPPKQVSLGDLQAMLAKRPGADADAQGRAHLGE